MKNDFKNSVKKKELKSNEITLRILVYIGYIKLLERSSLRQAWRR